MQAFRIARNDQVKLSMTEFQFMRNDQFQPQHIYQDSKLLDFLMQWYILFLPGWSGVEFKCTVHVALLKCPINQFKTVMQSRQQALQRSLFTTSKTDHHLLRQKLRQRISVMETNTAVFVVFKTKRELKCQFSASTEII